MGVSTRHASQSTLGSIEAALSQSRIGDWLCFDRLLARRGVRRCCSQRYASDASTCVPSHSGRMADDHDVHFESADAGASLTYPQQAGTIRKNAFIVIKGRPCKVRASAAALIAPVIQCAQLMSTVASGAALSSISCMRLVASGQFPLHVDVWCHVWRQVVDVSTSKTGKHGHAKCHFVALDIFTGKKLEDLQPSSHNCDASLRPIHL